MDIVVHKDSHCNRPQGKLGRFVKGSHHVQQRRRILGVSPPVSSPLPPFCSFYSFLYFRVARLGLEVNSCRIFNNISKTSDIPLKSDYALFKKGVRPEWEDAANKEGGKWSYQFKRNAGIDELWLYTVAIPTNLTYLNQMTDTG